MKILVALLAMVWDNRDMNTTNFTNGQLKWASQHDWFVSGNQTEIVGQSDVVDCNVNPPVLAGVDRQTFTNFQALRDWAGY